MEFPAEVAPEPVKKEFLLCQLCNEISPGLNAYIAHLQEHKSKEWGQPEAVPVLAALPKWDLKFNEKGEEGKEAPENAETKLAFNKTEIFNIISQSMLLKEYIKTVIQNKQAVPKKKAGGKAYMCSRCPFETKFIQHLNSHTKSHKENKILFKCESCGVEFSQKANLQRHAGRHKQDPQFKCQICFKQFYRKDQRNEHLLSHWTRYEIVLTCPVDTCGVVLQNRNLLKKHIEVEHSEGSPLGCLHCNRKFQKSIDINRHALKFYAAQFGEVYANNGPMNPVVLDARHGPNIGNNVIGIHYSADEAEDAPESAMDTTPSPDEAGKGFAEMLSNFLASSTNSASALELLAEMAANVHLTDM